VPPDGWPDRLVVTQRVTALDFEYVGDSARWLPHLPDMPRQRIRLPDDGAIHPALEFGWSPVQETGFGVQVAASATGLPLVPDGRDGTVCDAAGQARAVIAMWAGAHATDDADEGLERLVDEAASISQSVGRAEGEAVLPIAENDVYGGFTVSLADARLALRLLERDVADRIAQRWAFLTDPVTTTSQLADALDVESSTDPSLRRRPFVAHPDPDIVRLGSRCR